VGGSTLVEYSSALLEEGFIFKIAGSLRILNKKIFEKEKPELLIATRRGFLACSTDCSKMVAVGAVKVGFYLSQQKGAP
jgi:hypothetical protein